MPAGNCVISFINGDAEGEHGAVTAGEWKGWECRALPSSGSGPAGLRGAEEADLLFERC